MPKYTNVSGVWKQEATGYINVNGVWKTKESEHVNVSGVWKPLAESGDIVDTFNLTFSTSIRITDAFFVANKYLYLTSDTGTSPSYVKVDPNTKSIVQTNIYSSYDISSTTTWSASEFSSTDAIILSDYLYGYSARWLNGSLNWAKTLYYRIYALNDGSDDLAAIHYKDLDDDIYYFKVLDSAANIMSNKACSSPKCNTIGVDSSGRPVFMDYYTAVFLNKSGSGYALSNDRFRNGIEGGGMRCYVAMSNGVEVFVGYDGSGTSGIGYCMKGDFNNRLYYKSYTSGTFTVHRAVGNDIIVSLYTTTTLTFYRITVNNTNSTTSGISLSIKYQKSFTSARAVATSGEYAFIISNVAAGSCTVQKVKL